MTESWLPITLNEQFFSHITSRTNYIRWHNVRFVPDQHTFRWIVIVLDHWNNSLWVDMSAMMIMSHHSDISSWFKANQSLLFFLSDSIVVCMLTLCVIDGTALRSKNKDLVVRSEDNVMQAHANKTYSLIILWYTLY